MKHIEVKVLNPQACENAEKTMVAMARLTQHGEAVHSMADFLKIYDKPYKDSFAIHLTELPHPTLQKFGVVNVIIVGASRRFLAQITRHQNEVKFMSASLQYSDYSDDAAYAIPYKVLTANPLILNAYETDCEASIRRYKQLVSHLGDHDSAGFEMPQALRNVLLISATPYQWRHMIGQRTCRRNSDETRIVMLKIWEELYKINPVLFKNCGPFCMQDYCREGSMNCGNMIDRDLGPGDILRMDYPALFEPDV